MDTPECVAPETRPSKIRELTSRFDEVSLEIYKLGMCHAAYLLRGTDSREVSNAQLDWCADFIEREVKARGAMATWEVPNG